MEFIKGKWYLYRYINYDFYIKSTENSFNKIYFKEFIDLKRKVYYENETICSYDNEFVTNIEISISEIQQYLPDGHEDKEVKMEIGKYYRVDDESGFWMIGKCSVEDRDSWRGHMRGIATFINKEQIFEEDGSWCYKIDDGTRNYKPASKEEIDWLNSCIAAGKYLDKPEEKYQYEVVHCETQEQWDFVTEKLGDKLLDYWDEYKQNSCIELSTQCYCDIDFYREKNSKIYSFQEWCAKFGHQFDEFKVGDWVVITKSNVDWVSEMNEFVGKCVQLNYTLNKKVVYGESGWIFKYGNNHFRKALPHEIPTTQTFKSVKSASITIPSHLEQDYQELKDCIGDSISKWEIKSNLLPKIPIIRVVSLYLYECSFTLEKNYLRVNDVINLENYQELIVIDYIKVGGVHLYACRLLDIEGKIESNHLKTGSYVIFKNVLTKTKLTYQEYDKPKGLIVRTIEPKQVKQEVKLIPIILNNHSRLKLK